MIPFSDMERAGLLPTLFSEDDPRPAYEQLPANYKFDVTLSRFTLTGNGTKDWRLRYPGNLPLEPVSFAMLRGVALVLFEDNWLAIIQPDGAYKVLAHNWTNPEPARVPPVS